MDDEMLVVMETDDGLLIRKVPPATPIPESDDPGAATEDVIRWTTMHWGLPDFVFAPKSVRTGRAVREIGDAVLYAGDLAAVVQVKARCAPPGDDERERAWIERKVTTAARQAAGTIRKLSSGKHALANERGAIVEIDGAATQWVPVVVIDHPAAPHMKPSPTPNAVVLHRRDWEFLFDQLKSTYAVIQYLQRVSEYGSVDLGREVVRYYQLAAADTAAPPMPVDSRFSAGVQRMSAPLLPQAPAGNESLRDHQFLRRVMEDLAVCGTADPSVDARDLIDALAALDKLPVAQRSMLGSTLLEWLDEVAQEEEGAGRWRRRMIMSPNEPLLLLTATGKLDEVRRRAFQLQVMLRHAQLREAMPDYGNELTVGVLVTPRRDERWPWDTTVAALRVDVKWAPWERETAERIFPFSEVGTEAPWEVPGRSANGNMAG